MPEHAIPEQDMPEKIILDTDPGIDDAMAIFFAMSSPKIDLLGLTTTFGNVSVDMATDNALRLVEMMDKEIPVAKGVAQPLVQEPAPFPDFVHGKDGFGNLNLAPPKGQAIDLSAAEFIVKTIMDNPNQITLIAIGPLGNLINNSNIFVTIIQYLAIFYIRQALFILSFICLTDASMGVLCTTPQRLLM